jgi:hypothetical protein
VRIPGELPPLSVIARRDIEEPVTPGSIRTQTVRITYENGVEVKRQVVQGAAPLPPHPLAERTARAGEGSDAQPWRWRDERSEE